MVLIEPPGGYEVFSEGKVVEADLPDSRLSQKTVTIKNRSIWRLEQGKKTNTLLPSANVDSDVRNRFWQWTIREKEGEFVIRLVFVCDQPGICS